MRIVITNEQDFISIQEKNLTSYSYVWCKRKKYRLSIVFKWCIAKLNERDLHS